MSDSLNLYLIEPHNIARQAFRKRILKQENLTLVGASDTLPDIADVLKAKPDLLLLSLEKGNQSLSAALQSWIKQLTSFVPIVVLTQIKNSELSTSLKQLGVLDVRLKQAGINELLNSIRLF